METNGNKLNCAVLRIVCKANPQEKNVTWVKTQIITASPKTAYYSFPVKTLLSLVVSLS